MNLERFTTDKEISAIGEKIMVMLATAKDFDISKPKTFRFVCMSFAQIIFQMLADKKDITEKAKEDTKAYAYGFMLSLMTKHFGIPMSSEVDIFMLDYMNANKDKLITEVLDNINIPDNPIKVN